MRTGPRPVPAPQDAAEAILAHGPRARAGAARDNAEDFAAAMPGRMAAEDAPEIERAFHGGAFCGLVCAGDPGKTESTRGRAG